MFFCGGKIRVGYCRAYRHLKWLWTLCTCSANTGCDCHHYSSCHWGAVALVRGCTGRFPCHPAEVQLKPKHQPYKLGRQWPELLLRFTVAPDDDVAMGQCHYLSVPVSQPSQASPRRWSCPGLGPGHHLPQAPPATHQVPPATPGRGGRDSGGAQERVGWGTLSTWR